MLSKPAKKVLKEIRELTGNTDKQFTRYSGENEFTLLENENRQTGKCSKYSGELSSIIDLLIDDGYLKKFATDCYQLSQAAIHSGFFEWASSRRFLLCNVVTPIVVSFITTVLTLLIKGLL